MPKPKKKHPFRIGDVVHAPPESPSAEGLYRLGPLVVTGISYASRWDVLEVTQLDGSVAAEKSDHRCVFSDEVRLDQFLTAVRRADGKVNGKVRAR